MEATLSSSVCPSGLLPVPVMHSSRVNLPRWALCCPGGGGQTHHHGDWHETNLGVWHQRINQWSNLRCPPLSYDVLEHYRQVAGLCWVSQLPPAESSSCHPSRHDSVSPAAKGQLTGLWHRDLGVCTLTKHRAHGFAFLPGILELLIPNKQKTDLLTLFVRRKIIFFLMQFLLLTHKCKAHFKTLIFFCLSTPFILC